MYAADVKMGPLPDVLDLEALERDSIYTCRDMDGGVWSPVHQLCCLGRTCPRCRPS